MYGSRVVVIEDSVNTDAEAAMADSMEASAAVLRSLSPDEQLGYAAYALRESGEYQSAKATRPRDGESWDSSPEMQHSCVPPDEPTGHAAEMMAMAGAPTSQRLTGSVAVGIIIVEGPNANLKFSAAERTKVVAEVQNGLGWLATQNPEGLVFKYDIKIVTLNVPPGPDTLTFDQKEARWRDPAMQKLGFATGMAGVSAYVEKIRSNLGTTWTYCAFFTKYPLSHFAYASIGGPRLVMHYDNDGWGPDNIDRVFAHETGHIFGAPDEYASSGCNCGGSWGFYSKPNANCANCAPSSGVDCLMKGNSWSMCVHTPYHLGFSLVQQTYTGVWRQGNDAHYLWVNSSWNSFVAKWQQLAQQNLRLVDLKIVNVGSQQRFFGVWRQGTGGHYLWVNADWNNFVTKWQQLAGQGLRLVDIEITQSAQGQRFSGVWLPGTDSYYLWAGADWQHFLAKWQEVSAQGLRLIDLDVVPASGAQSPKPDSGSMGFGGLAAVASADEEDGMGGGEASADGEAGYGMGSATGEALGSATGSGGLPGEGGGSFGGLAISANGSPTGVDSNGIGGGTAPTVDSSVPPELVMEGFGGGSVR